MMQKQHKFCISAIECDASYPPAAAKRTMDTRIEALLRWALITNCNYSATSSSVHAHLDIANCEKCCSSDFVL